MELRTLPPDEEAVRRFLDELWLPYHRDLEAAVESHVVADDLDEALPMQERVDFWLDHLEPETAQAWVVVEGDETDDPDAAAQGPIADLDADLVGFVTTHVDECPDVFARPDQLLIGDIYVAAEYRGTDVASRLIDRAAQRAEETGCGGITLNVDVDNERALAFYEKMGFEPLRHKLHVEVDEI